MTEIDKTNEGRRVELIYTNDPYTKLRPGDKGTYEFELKQSNPLENQHSIKWDSGSGLMMVRGDRWNRTKTISDGEE